MASPETPLLTRVALAENWQAGWLVLHGAAHWPAEAMRLLPDMQDNIEGKRGWIGRRHAMHTLQQAFLYAECRAHYCAARLLGVSPTNQQTCAEIAQMLSDEMIMHNYGPTVSGLIRGWARLAEGCCIVEGDPIKAARDAAGGEIEFTASDVTASDDVVPPPTPEEVAAAPILDDWEWGDIEGALYRNVRGLISGDRIREDGQSFGTTPALRMHSGKQWITTSDGLYRLGCKQHDLEPIVRAALSENRQIAWAMSIGITGRWTLSPEIAVEAERAGDPALTRAEQFAAAKTVGDALAKGGRKLLARAWLLLSADAEDQASCAAPYLFLLAAAGGIKDHAVKAVVIGWEALAKGQTYGIDILLDANVAAHRIADSVPAPEAEEATEENSDPPAGVMVIPSLGGTKETSGGKEAAREFKDLLGKRIPLALAPEMFAARAALHDEFPHACAQIDTLLTGMVQGEPIRWRSCLITGSAGGGKSRLVRRLSEVLGVGLHRFDAAGSADNAFSGTPRRWTTGEPCIPLEAVRRYKIANPLVLIDEIDKGSNSRHNGSAENSLMPFLEIETSRAYPDPYIERDIDVSNVGFMLTCNVETALPNPLRDRLLVVRMPEPGIEHLPALARGIVADIGRAAGDPRWWPELSDGELAVAESLWRGGSVRRLRAIVERIVAYRESKPRN